jgi:hypothetical protein
VLTDPCFMDRGSWIVVADNWRKTGGDHQPSCPTQKAGGADPKIDPAKTPHRRQVKAPTSQSGVLPHTASRSGILVSLAKEA